MQLTRARHNRDSAATMVAHVGLGQDGDGIELHDIMLLVEPHTLQSFLQLQARERFSCKKEFQLQATRMREADMVIATSGESGEEEGRGR